MNYFTEKFRRHGSELNSHDVLKFIAITLMVIDHLGMYFYPDLKSLRLAGRFSFPIFFFLIGYSLNYRFRFDLLLAALLLLLNLYIIKEPPPLPLNILFSVILCRAFFQFLQNKITLAQDKVILFIILAILTTITQIFFEYGTLAFLLAAMGFLVRRKENHKAVIVAFILTASLYSYYQILGFVFNYTMSAILVVGMLGFSLLLANYHFRKFPKVPKLVAYPVMFIGRNSLVIYFIHVLAFKWMKVLLF